ncbi:MAG: type VI secretion system accessory protein TagJ [Chromatiales bacterium]
MNTKKMTGSQLFTAGDLTGAVTALTDEVRQHPTDRESRGLLAEMLCLAGELERADKQLEVLSNQDPEMAPALAIVRQVIRAELARREFYSLGRLPEFLQAPGPQLKKHLQASILIRENNDAEAAQLLEEAEQERRHPSGVCNDSPFDDFRDLDDLNACYLEVLASNGKYFWVPLEVISSIEFRPPERPRDLMWRRALLDIHDGPDSEVFIPAIYADPKGLGTDQSRLGRITDWLQSEGSPVLGMGQRTYLVGDRSIPIMELESVTFEQAAAE